MLGADAVALGTPTVVVGELVSNDEPLPKAAEAEGEPVLSVLPDGAPPVALDGGLAEAGAVRDGAAALGDRHALAVGEPVVPTDALALADSAAEADGSNVLDARGLDVGGAENVASTVDGALWL